ncbi:MAG: phosphatidylserine decarboxylase 1 [Vezdaea aestivalis]|nr:MAG: phosphatidylserine decarboxylase 1 [Vezdaea aestivalis]
MPGPSSFNPQRAFSNSARRSEQESHDESFRSRLSSALRKTKIEWYPIPIGVGIGFLGLFQFYRIRERERTREDEEGSQGQREGEKRPKKRKKIRPSGPWQVQVLSTLPLKAMSRVWGWFNELTIPYYLRVPGFKLYAFIFGANLTEISEPDLHSYPNLAAFFYRTLKPGARPLDSNPTGLLSPADGRVLQFGTIHQGQVEQVKGMTYSLDALLGATPPSNFSNGMSQPEEADHKGDAMADDAEFARVNGISYTPTDLLGPAPPGAGGERPSAQKSEDMSTTPRASSEAFVRADLALGSSQSPWWTSSSSSTPAKTALYYAVVYLAPGDYHRIHSPASWVCTTRRHFAGELYSVSPYLQRTLPGLFTLNERVVLLGKWRWGFFSVTPVGATNVGSIRINFDRELRTNSLLTDTQADRAAEEARVKDEPWAGFVEASYERASKLLGGHALKKGEEMGGFRLGSTVVIVFEAPVGGEGKEKGGWKWGVEKGQRVKVGESLGWVEE